METSLEPIYKTNEVHDSGQCETKLSKQGKYCLSNWYWFAPTDESWLRPKGIISKRIMTFFNQVNKGVIYYIMPNQYNFPAE